MALALSAITVSNESVSCITVEANPIGVAVTADGSKVYVANSGADSVSVINCATNLVTATFPAGSGPTSFGNFIGP